MNENELNNFEQNEIDRIVVKITDISKREKKLTHKQIKEIIDEELKNDNPNYKDMEDWSIHYSKERIMTGVFSDKRICGERGNLSLSWFNFYVYFRLPVGIVIGILFFLKMITAPLSALGGLIALLYVIDIAVSGILFWGLKERRLWAWKMNLIILILTTLTYPLEKSGNISEFLLFFIVFALLWLLPNLIYFKKRKYLFS